MRRHALVAGWFSFPGMGATAGDLLARDLCRARLAAHGWSADIAVAPPFTGGIAWETADPAAYDLLVFVCGPFGNGGPLTELLARFHDVPLAGLDLSILDPLATWDPFRILVERDSERAARPDITFHAAPATVPVIGVVLVHPQKEYPGGMHTAAEAAVGRLLGARDAACVPIDTRLDENRTGLASAGQVDTLIGRMDAVVTTRLHGTVLALRHGIPPLVIDPIAGGRKVLAQARAIGWPAVVTADALDDATLARMLDWCLSPEGRAEAERARARGAAGAEAALAAFGAELDALGEDLG